MRLRPDRLVRTPEPHASAAERSGPPRLSIVVLPFANLGGDPEQEYFVDGVTESLTTDLSRISGSFVIARNTAFTYKGKPFDVKQIGRELNVRYVLEGSVQRSGNRLRVNVQLIDAESGTHLWAERFDKPVADLFDMQDEIVARLANTLGYELVRAEAQKSTRSSNLDAIDLIMRGWAALWQPATKESTASARDYFERALKIDPQNAEAMVGFAQRAGPRHRLRLDQHGRGYLRRAVGPAYNGDCCQSQLCLRLLLEEPGVVPHIAASRSA